MALIVRSKVKSVVKGFRLSGDLYNALDKKVEDILKEASVRAKKNGRSTIRPHDL